MVRCERSYYYLVAGFPELALDDGRLPISLGAARDEVLPHLDPADRKLVELVFLPYDNANLLAALAGADKAHDPLGLLGAGQIESGRRFPEDLPAYMRPFVDAVRLDSALFPGLSRENELTRLFYEYATAFPHPFAKAWFGFDRDLRNVLAALACRRFSLPVEAEVLGEDYVAEMLRKSSAADFGLARELSWLDRVLALGRDGDILERELALDRLRWETVDEAATGGTFSAARLAALFVKLGIAERWYRLDAGTGRGLFRQILQDLEAGFRFPEEFSLIGGRTHGNNR